MIFKSVSEWYDLLKDEMFKGVVLPTREIYTYRDMFDIYNVLYPTRLIAFNFEDAVAPTMINAVVQNIFRLNYYKYETLAKTERFEYNPIENYSMTEKSKDFKKDIDVQTNDLREETQINNNAVSNSESGTKVENSENELKNVTTFDNIVDFKPTEKNDVNTENNTNSTGKNTTTSNGNNINIKTGTVKHDSHNFLSHNFTRSGNIGVTTTQQMILSERDVADFSTLKVFFDDINKHILLSIY